MAFKIAIVHDWLTGFRGGEKCLEVLCRAFPEASLHTLLRVRDTASPAIERMDIHTSFLQCFPGIRHYYRWCLPLMPAAVSRLRIPEDVDVVVSFSHAVAKSVHVPPGVPHICYCFTPMRYAWHRREDYFGKGRLRGMLPWNAARAAVLRGMRRWDRETSQGVTHFIAASKTVATRIVEAYYRSSRVIYPPVDTDFYTPDAGVKRDDFYLYVGALAPYKRVDLAVTACEQLGRRFVVIGSGPEARRLKRMAGRYTQFLGHRCDEEIRHYMRSAAALLFPANEDFGIVPVEAQACGTPVIAFGEGGATETVVSADAANYPSGLFFEEQTPQSLFRAIRRFERMPGRFDPHVLRTLAERFSRPRFERELLRTIKGVVCEKLECSPVAYPKGEPVAVRRDSRRASPTPEWSMKTPPVLSASELRVR
jgi:glycosyltransferase involved in cell wall biosynthesis